RTLVSNHLVDVSWIVQLSNRTLRLAFVLYGERDLTPRVGFHIPCERQNLGFAVTLFEFRQPVLDVPPILRQNFGQSDGWTVYFRATAGKFVFGFLRQFLTLAGLHDAVKGCLHVARELLCHEDRGSDFFRLASGCHLCGNGTWGRGSWH